MKKSDPNQIDLFAGTDFAPQIIVVKKKIEERKLEIKRDYKDIANSTDLVINFAKRFKHSLAFLDCVLSGKLPGDYHGTKLWIRNFGSIWTDEFIEDADYWINLGYQIIEQKETIYIIKRIGS